MHTLTKRQLRQQLRQSRKNLPLNIRQHAQTQTNQYLKQWIKRNKRIAVYWALGSELALHSFIKTAKKRGAQIYLPYIEPQSLKLWFTPYPTSSKSKMERKRGNAQLHVPQWQGKKIRAKQLHSMILPIVGIDQQGYRLGQGGGYYDCTLSHTPKCLKPQTIAAGFACQQIAVLPRLAHDICTDFFVCEQGITYFPN